MKFKTFHKLNNTDLEEKQKIYISPANKKNIYLIELCALFYKLSQVHKRVIN